MNIATMRLSILAFALLAPASGHDEIQIVNRESSKCLTENNWRKAVLLPCGKDKQTWRALASGLIKNVATNHCLFANKRGMVKVGRCNDKHNRVVSKTRDGALLMHGTPSGHGIVTPVHTDISFGLSLAKRVQGGDAQKFDFRPIDRNPTPSPRAAPNGAHSSRPSSEPSSTPTSIAHSDAPSVKHSAAPSLKHSDAPSVKHSAAPSLKHSATPSVKHSAAPSLTHSAAPSVAGPPSGTYEYEDDFSSGLASCVRDGSSLECISIHGDLVNFNVNGNEVTVPHSSYWGTGIWNDSEKLFTFAEPWGTWSLQ